VGCRAVAQFANETDSQAAPTITRDRETNCIGSTFAGQTRAGSRVAKVTEFADLVRRRLGILVARGTAMSPPARAKRQARRMDPGSVLTLRGRHEKRASHACWRCGHCTQ